MALYHIPCKTVITQDPEEPLELKGVTLGELHGYMSPLVVLPPTPPPRRFLRLLSEERATGDRLYPLSASKEVFIGREPNCQIVLDSRQYGRVSRRHAVIRPLYSALGIVNWEIWDLNSANGTYVNGERIRENQCLQVGDRITLGQDGPQFIFESEGEFEPSESGKEQSSDSVSLTQLFPLISTGRDLPKKANLFPILVTVIFVVLMFTQVGNPDSTNFNRILGIYLGGANYYFIYKLCGRHKPWWVLLGVALTTVLLMNSPLWSLLVLVFRRILPGDVPDLPRAASFFSLLVGNFFGAGLMEELLKALPLLGAYFLGRILPDPWGKQVGISDPLDGILLGTASGLGFTLVETLSQYVPSMMDNFGPRAGWQLVIPRILGSIVCHLAYSGYLGYFIGLSILKPTRRGQILAVGYLTVSFLHALWNSVSRLDVWLLVVVGILSYAFLAGAILKARTLSALPHSHS